ncbi:hypothetical protein POF50_030555 [Streptomyces sp. SL13]|uniref:Uncharacterized protein n=1 Tax=Streptantibioticus silvisoli TaxID=2705255 RepID=A0AA90H9H4_9ACTN|nr:hypothetical protein [Streptantibioticus silvisoli]MDI5973630.1 hypothetical protein [Streptantibioticus silvisoli]
MEPRMKYCYTCRSDEMHRPLTDVEKTWLKQKTGRKYVHDCFMCTAEGCRNVREGGNKHPFDPVIRIPTDLE